jgi:hypothetical protein
MIVKRRRVASGSHHQTEPPFQRRLESHFVPLQKKTETRPQAA